MKKFLLALAFSLFSLSALADRADDVLQLTDPDYCSFAANQYFLGARSQAVGFGRAIDDLSPGIIELAEHGVPVPTDAMHVMEWDKYNDHEKWLIETHLYRGWDDSKAAGGMKDDAINEKAQEYYDACIEDRSQEKHQ